MQRSAITLLFACASVLIGLGPGCGDDGDDFGGLAGNPGEACIDGMLCTNNLECVEGICMAPQSTSNGSEGDGDPAGDGDGDPAGDGDGDTSGGDVPGLYGGPCLTSDDCEADLFCAYANGRYWCTSECAGADDTSCPAHPSASAPPECKSVVDNDGGAGSKWGCTLVCTEEAQCPAGAQCFGSGIGSDLWCGFLP